jgi:2-haloalkanoic acid dehalogenase type II
MTKPFPETKVLFFDLMGTCCDWHTSILSLLTSLPSPRNLPQTELSAFALAWREGFFEEIHARFTQGLPQEDIDVTHGRVLDSLLAERGVKVEDWEKQVRDNLVKGWHEQIAWPDVIPALRRLKERLFIVVLANGTTRLQLDITKCAKLEFDMLLNSQLLGCTKPDPLIYRKAAELVGVEVGKCVMVAAHAYDLRVARKVGMGTVYVRRETEDQGENFEDLEREVDLFLDGRGGSVGCGLGLLAEALGC